MLEHIKRNYVNICIVFVYTVIASLVYGIWSYSAWQLWYVTFIIVLLIVAAGCVIGYLWIHGEIRKSEKKEKSAEERNVQ